MKIIQEESERARSIIADISAGLRFAQIGLLLVSESGRSGVGAQAVLQAR